MAALPAFGSVIQIAGLSPAKTKLAANRFCLSDPYYITEVPAYKIKTEVAAYRTDVSKVARNVRGEIRDVPTIETILASTTQTIRTIHMSGLFKIGTSSEVPQWSDHEHSDMKQNRFCSSRADFVTGASHAEKNLSHMSMQSTEASNAIATRSWH